MMVEKKVKQIEIIEKKGDPLKIANNLRRNRNYSKTDNPDYDRLKASMDFAEKHNTIKDRVKSILKFDKFSRKNDLWLYLIYLAKMGHINLKVDINQFSQVSSPESITRARRKLFEEIREGQHPNLKHLMDKDTEEIRKDQEMLYREHYGK